MKELHVEYKQEDLGTEVFANIGAITYMDGKMFIAGKNNDNSLYRRTLTLSEVGRVNII